MKILSQVLDAPKILDIQRVQYQERLTVKAWIKPSFQQQIKVNVGNLGHFLCQWISGSFTTLAVKPPPFPIQPLQDTGINYLSAKLIDGTGNKELYNDYIPLDLWLSPGRTRANTLQIPAPFVLNPAPNPDSGGPSNTLFVPTEFEYLFSANSEIILDTKNESDAPNYLAICFHGIRIKTKAGGR